MVKLRIELTTLLDPWTDLVHSFHVFLTSHLAALKIYVTLGEPRRREYPPDASVTRAGLEGGNKAC